MSSLTEDKLVQQTTADYFRDVLQWVSIYAYNEEVLGPEGTLGRTSEKEIVLERYLRRALEKLNPDLPAAAYESAIKQITETSVSKPTLQANREKYALYKNGAKVSFRNEKGEIEMPACGSSTLRIPKRIISWWYVSCGCKAPYIAEDRIYSDL